jgi:hypothetical protein
LTTPTKNSGKVIVAFTMLVRKRAAVCLFGWFGARSAQLSRLAGIYDGLDADVELFKESLVSSLQFREQTADICALRQKVTGRPLLVHVFSMNGAASFLKTLTDERLDLQPGIDLRGLIFDSAPARMRLGELPEPFGNAMFPRNKWLAAAATFVIRPVFHLYCMASGKGQKDLDRFTRGFFGRPFNVPTLVLASERDTTLEPGHMRDYAESVARAGVPVQTRFWPDSQWNAMAMKSSVYRRRTQTAHSSSLRPPSASIDACWVGPRAASSSTPDGAPGS